MWKRPELIAPLGLALFISFVFWSISHFSNAAQRDRFITTCIESDGTPVELMIYTKGYGDDRACVKLAGKVERQ